MPIILDHQLREQIPHNATEFPITYFHNELEFLPNWAGPLHWHPDFEIATAKCGVLDYRVGQQHIEMKPGDSIFVNGNVLHGIRQLSGDAPDPMPNIVFSGTLIGPQSSTVYQKYVQPIIQCDTIPFVVFRCDDKKCSAVLELINSTYDLLNNRGETFEMKVQRNISAILEYVFVNLRSFPKSEFSRIQISNQVRLQKMLSFIYDHYAEQVTLEDIAKAADISRSEAGRCFNTYMNCSPVNALIQYRLQMAHSMLIEKNKTMQEISFSCGFNSVNYFSRQFKKTYGYAPGSVKSLGK